MSIYYTEDIQMYYDENQPIFKQEPKKQDNYFVKKAENVELRGRQINEYKVTWIDHLQNKYQVTLKIYSDMTIKEFLYIVIGEFNQTFKRVEVDYFFFINDCNIYELFEIDEEGKPDEELPSYDENQRLNKIITNQFALKQTILFMPNLMISSLSDPQSLKSPISPRSDEEKINPQNNHIQNTEKTEQHEEQHEEQEIFKLKEESQPQKPWWYFCCSDD